MKGRYTRYKLMAAFNTLLESYEFDDIQVSMIAEKCGLSRQAFYKSFDSKQDLCMQMIPTLFRDCLRGTGSFTWEQLSRAYLAQMLRFNEFFHALASQKNQFVTSAAIFWHLSALCCAMAQYSSGNRPEGDLLSVIQCYCTGVTFSYMTILRKGLDPGADQVTRRLTMAMPEVLKPLLTGRQFPESVHGGLFSGREDDGLDRFSVFLKEFSA